MIRTFSSCALALFAAAALHAQDTTIKTETRIKADDAKVMTDQRLSERRSDRASC